MTSQENGNFALTAVVNAYNKCCRETPLTPKSFVGLTQAFIRYYNTRNRRYRIYDKLLDCKAWDYTDELGDALRPFIDIYTLQSKKQGHLDHKWSALVDTSACITILTSSQKSSQDGHQQLSEVLKTKAHNVEEILEELLSCDASTRDIMFMLVTEYTALSVTARRRCVECLIACIEDTRRDADRLSVETSGNAMRETMISDLRNAFRGHFYESRNENGLSSLDRFNLSLRANLFMSHYSILVQRDRSVSAPGRGLPFYPYMALVQSSGSGKSRLLREVGKTLPLVYGNLNAPDSKGYPLPNISLRRFLLWQGDVARDSGEAASDQCEERCEMLLLVTVIVFYLLFSSRDDTRKKVIRPSANVLQRKIEERAWQAVGICERDEDPDRGSVQSQSDFFWDIVVTVTESLMYPRANGFSDYGKGKYNTMGFLNGGDQLLELEELLHDLGATVLAPKGTKASMSKIWDNSITFRTTAEDRQDRQPTPVAESCSNMQRCKSRSEAREGALNFLQRYLEIRMITKKETLPEIAKSLQQLNSQESLDVTDARGLCALFLAFDESRCLTTSTIRNSRALRGDNEQDSNVSIFRCLRRVLRRMYEKNGVSVFMVFSDTVAKLANFAPQRSRDPSARMMPGEGSREYPGQMFSPFIALGTESTGVMLAEGKTFDFRQRTESFCATWGSPNIESNVESVTEDITSFPCEVLKGQLSANKTFCSDSRIEDEVIFRSDDDYVHLGRPLWASTMAHNQKGASWRHMVIFALEKLLGGCAFLSEDSSVYVKQCLAALGCRIPLQFVEYCGIAPQLIAEHMAWCTNVSWDREGVYLRYINEPLLATAAAVLWDQHLVGMLQCLVARCGSYVSNKGDLGEVAACVLLIAAVDSAYKRRGRKGVSEDKSEGSDGDIPSPAKLQYGDRLMHIPKGLTMFGIVSVKEFLESGFTLRVLTIFKRGILRPIEDHKTERPVGYAWLSGAGAGAPSPRSESVIFVPEFLAAAHVRFKSIKRVAAAVGCRDIPFLFEANVALLAHKRQKGIDLLIPLRMRIPCGNDKHQTKWSCLTIQVKNRRRSARASTVAGRYLDPKFTEAVHCDVGERGDCDRCIWMKENHFGIVLNVYDGTTPENEQGLGPLWTFIDTYTHSDVVTNNPASPPMIKKRKLSCEPWYDEEVVTPAAAGHPGEPQSAYLIVNGLCGETGSCPRVRCNSEILRQLEILVAQDAFSGIVKRKSQQEVNAVQEVVAVASKEDQGNFSELQESANLVTSLARELEKSLARKN